MKSSLPAYVQTYSFGSRKAVSDLIVLAKNNSRSAASIAQSLEGLSSINQYNGLSIAPYALASFEAFLEDAPLYEEKEGLHSLSTHTFRLEV